MNVVYCRDCIHSKTTDDMLRCMHPKVNAGDVNSLVSLNEKGADPWEERSTNLFRKCGMRGALWEKR
jgi:hypothetical protein